MDYPVTSIALLVFVTLFLGVAAGFWIAKKSSRASTSAAVVLGFVSGSIIGMSSSPILASTITALLGFLGIILPPLIGAKYLPEEGGPDGQTEYQKIRPQLKVSGIHLSSFGAMLFLGILFGMTMRVNDLLDFQTRNLRTQYTEMGFDENQINQLLDNYIASQHSIENISESVKNELGESPGTSLLSHNASQSDWKDVWSRVDAINEAGEKIGFLYRSAPEPDRESVQQYIDQQSAPMLEVLKEQYASPEE